MLCCMPQVTRDPNIAYGEQTMRILVFVFSTHGLMKKNNDNAKQKQC